MAASDGEGPKAACSRKRRAAAAETPELELPTCTTRGADDAVPFDTMRLTEPVVEVKPETPSAIAVCEVILSGVPPNDAVDVAVKPVPATVAVKEPSGNVAGFSDWITGAG